jgi:phosphoadenosine phosphosulfate reductase
MEASTRSGGTAEHEGRMQLTADEIRAISDQFESRTPRELLQWTVDQFGPRAAISTAFGPEGLVILDVAMREVTPRLPVFTIDTGFLFPETQALIAAVEQRYSIQIERLVPDLTPEQQAAEHGPELFRRDPDRCCHIRKVLPLQKKLPQLDAMVNGLRRSQGGHRKDARMIQPQMTPDGYRYLKINPLAGWNREEVWWYIVSHHLPYNALHDQNYASIGCTPDCCTRPVQPGESERSGRWSGKDKKECGLHTFAANI